MRLVKVFMKKLLIPIISLAMSASTYSGALNDTGITYCRNAIDFHLSCPQINFPGQDAEYGRDSTYNDNSDGHVGFSYTKIDMNGNNLPTAATVWSCVRDNVTGLTWEVKTDDGGLRDKDWTYTWYNTNTLTNGGASGTANGGTCDNNTDCDTEKYISKVNLKIQLLCGYSDWRMPSRKELLNLRVLQKIPMLDRNYFSNSIGTFYWSALPSVSYSDSAAYVDFRLGGSNRSYKSTSFNVRLVRSGQ